MCFEDKTMAFIYLRPMQREMSSGSFARKVVPTVGQQHSLYIHKQRHDWKRLFIVRPPNYFVKSE